MSEKQSEARVLALEKALRKGCEPCDTCVHNSKWPKDCGLCEASFGGEENNWEFDEARFSDGTQDAEV